MKQEKNKIDFVIPWVDGNDPNWRKERAKYDGTCEGDSTDVRFRDWDNLQYWFRGVEKFAPWVNQIHFITWGHIPEWMNTENPKLHIVKHEDYIPKEYLPTFNSHTIELNMNRIQGLSEQFVYFNDDMFLTAPVTEELFFKNGMPRDNFALNAICFGKDTAGNFNGNDIGIINDHFSKKKMMKKNWRKWFSPANGIKSIFRTTMLLTWRWFPGFYYGHLPENYLKSTLDQVWNVEQDTLDRTCSSRFREQVNVNQWLFKFWQLASGNFVPISYNRGKCFHIHDDIAPAVEAIKKMKYKIICLNDTSYTTEFEDKKEKVNEAFQSILSEKSSFER